MSALGFTTVDQANSTILRRNEYLEEQAYIRDSTQMTRRLVKAIEAGNKEDADEIVADMQNRFPTLTANLGPIVARSLQRHAVDPGVLMLLNARPEKKDEMAKRYNALK